MQVTFKTHCEVTLEGRSLTPLEIYALLDWCLGELNTDQTREYAKRCAYPNSIRDLAEPTP